MQALSRAPTVSKPRFLVPYASLCPVLDLLPVEMLDWSIVLCKVFAGGEDLKVPGHVKPTAIFAFNYPLKK